MESITARLDALENENKFYKRVFSAAMQAAGEQKWGEIMKAVIASMQK